MQFNSIDSCTVTSILLLSQPEPRRFLQGRTLAICHWAFWGSFDRKRRGRRPSSEAENRHTSNVQRPSQAQKDLPPPPPSPTTRHCLFPTSSTACTTPSLSDTPYPAPSCTDIVTSHITSKQGQPDHSSSSAAQAIPWIADALWNSTGPK